MAKYKPEFDYVAKEFKPFKKAPDDSMCDHCEKYYQNLYDEGMVNSPIPPNCSRSILENLVNNLDSEDFDSQDDFNNALIVSDPCLWAEEELKWKPRWYQEWYLECTCDSKVLRIGRRAGKSEVMIVECLHSMYTNSHFTILMVAHFDSAVVKFFDKIREFIGKSPKLTESVQRDVKNPSRIEFKNGSKIVGFSLNPNQSAAADKIRGQDANLIVVDELDFIKDDDLDVLFAIKASHPNCKVIAASTPSGARNKFYQLCFPKGTKIRVPGYNSKNIEDIKLGDTVLDCVGRQDKVTHLFEHEYTGPLYTFKFKKNYRQLSSTEEHPHFVIKKGKTIPKFIESSKIEVGDRIGVTLESDFPDRLSYPELEVSRKINLNNQHSAKRLITEGHIGIVDERVKKSYKETLAFIDKVNSDPKLEKALMRFLGYYLAEGHICIHDKKYINGIQTTHALNEPAAKEVEDLARLLFPEATIVRKEQILKTGSSEYVRVYSRVVGRVCLHYCGSIHDRKKIENSIFGSKFIEDFIETYHIGDGHISNGARVWTTTSEDVAYQLWCFLLSKGRKSSISKYNRDNRKTAYLIRELKSNSKQILFFHGMPFLEIKEIEKKPISEKVFNFETKYTHTYSAEGFATHNCVNKNSGFKEFWFIAQESPVFTEETEKFFRNQFTESRYEREVYAVFGEAEEGVFKAKFIDKSISDYDIENSVPNPDGYYIFGVDWNKTHGTHIVILSVGGGKLILVKKIVIPESEYTQTDGVNKIIELNEIWKPKYIFADRGYGSSQGEQIKKYGLRNPHTNLHNKFIDIAMNQHITYKDPETGLDVKKPAKPYLVQHTAKLLEDDCLVLPKSEDTDATESHNMGLVQQMRNYQVINISTFGLPMYSKENEHTLVAYFVACGGYILHEGDLAIVDYNTTIRGIMFNGPPNTEDTLEQQFVEYREGKVKDNNVPSRSMDNVRARGIVADSTSRRNIDPGNSGGFFRRKGF